jgi:ElaB/YqjD/DUF883 family membrane-anchored ribosome-binding protein
MAAIDKQDGADASTAEAAKQKAQEAKGQARVKLREQVDERTTQAGERVGTAAGDMRSVAEELRRQGKDAPAKYAEQAAERAERLGGYLKESDGETVLRDVEDFARRNPWAVAAAGLALGFMASRLLKASSTERYRQSPPSGYSGPRDPAAGYGSSATGSPSSAVPAEPPAPAVAGRP